MSFDLPSTVKIIAHKYQVKKMPEFEKRQGDFLGVCRNSELEILIDDRWKDQLQANTLLHEILHAVACQMGKLEGKSEEKVVEVMANGLCAVMRDNPTLFPAIQKGLIGNKEG